MRTETFPPVASLDPTVDHVRGPADGHVILEYGDYECPYPRAAYRAIQSAERQTGVRFAFRHFPLTAIHPHALAAATAAEAAARQGRFWEMSEVLFQRQRALGDREFRVYAAELGLDLARFDVDRLDRETLARVRRDVVADELAEVRTAHDSSSSRSARRASALRVRVLTVPSGMLRNSATSLCDSPPQ